MKWLENNPLGVAMAGLCAVMLLITAALGFTWGRPASSGAETVSGEEMIALPDRKSVAELGSIGQYKEVNDRPLFSSTRRPEVVDDSDALDVDESEVADPPEVTLSGVVITPDQKIVTMRPVKGGDSLIISENAALGEGYPGWSVSEVLPRSIRLESSEGETMTLDLVVNNEPIEQPPEPEPVAGESSGENDADESADGDAPLSRAEEIRRRIAERREELRRQAQDNEENSKPALSAYSQAIQNMGKKRKENDDNDDDSDGGNE